METTKTPVKYPENLYLRDMVKESGQTISHIARKIGYARPNVSDTIHGHYKGTNIIPLILAHFNK